MAGSFSEQEIVRDIKELPMGMMAYEEPQQRGNVTSYGRVDCFYPPFFELGARDWKTLGMQTVKGNPKANDAIKGLEMALSGNGERTEYHKGITGCEDHACIELTSPEEVSRVRELFKVAQADDRCFEYYTKTSTFGLSPKSNIVSGFKFDENGGFLGRFKTYYADKIGAAQERQNER